MTAIYSILTLILSTSLLCLAQVPVPSIPNCGLPADTSCLITSAQYTVVATVESTNQRTPPGNSLNYNATLRVQCVYSSFSEPVSSGQNLAGKALLVANWGFPKDGCPPNTGSTATVGSTQIFFLYVAVPPAQGAPAESAVYSVQSICVGGVDYNSQNMQTLAKTIKRYPQNAIAEANRGGSQCTLPAVPDEPTPTSSPSAVVPDNDASRSASYSLWTGLSMLFAGLLF
jgi:hypothetical protein